MRPPPGRRYEADGSVRREVVHSKLRGVTLDEYIAQMTPEERDALTASGGYVQPFGWQERATEAFAQRSEVAYFEQELRNKLRIGAAMRGGDPGMYAGSPVLPPIAVNARGELVSLDTPFARAVAKAYDVPDALVGIPTPWWRRIMQWFTRRARQRARRG